MLQYIHTRQCMLTHDGKLGLLVLLHVLDVLCGYIRCYRGELLVAYMQPPQTQAVCASVPCPPCLLCIDELSCRGQTNAWLFAQTQTRA